MSERLKRTIGDSGEVGRLGGDEFQVVLPGIISEDRLADIARSVIVNLSHPYMVEGNQIVIGASVGIAIADGRHHAGAETLIRNADLALYSAKENGRGIWKFYSEDMHKVAHERRALEGELRAALQAGGMSIAYQPVINVASETISGFEALARWQPSDTRRDQPRRVRSDRRGIRPDHAAWRMGVAHCLCRCCQLAAARCGSP